MNIHSVIFRHISLSRRKVKPKPPKNIQIILNTTAPIAIVDERYLSFSIDISVIAGGFWWEGSSGVKKGLGTLRVPPLNLHSNNIDRLVRELGPSYLRVGGSEADKIHYFECKDTAESDPLILTMAIWDNLHAFLQRNSLSFIFTFKYGVFNRAEHGSWSENEIEQLIQYSKEKGYKIDVCELGNELNAYWAFYGLSSQPMAKKLADDYMTFTQHIREHYPEAKICGPGSAFWPILGETIKPFTNLTKKFLQSLSFEIDIIDWHYYPFQSHRSPVRTRTATLRKMLSPRSFESFSKYSNQLKNWRDAYHPKAELWTGETGSGQCGGEPKHSDRFISSFWWADQLGRGAVLGQKVMVRQSLIGGEYGLIDRLTLKPRPDYWVSCLWVKLMGEDVYEVESNNKFVKVYCHRTKNSTGYTLLIINVSKSHIKIDINNLGLPGQRYELTAKRLKSKKVKINGLKPKVRKKGLDLSEYPNFTRDNVIKPYSINFWCY